VVLLGLAVLGACTRTPDEPGFDNPFDPAGTNPGAGYGLVVVSRGDSIVMTWDNLPGVVGYSVYWSSDSPDFEGMELVSENVSIVEGSLLIEFSHREFLAEKTNWYRIQGRTWVDRFPDDPDPDKVNILESDPVAVDITVMVQPSDGRTTTPTRTIDLIVLTGVADSVELSEERSFEPPKVRVVGVTPGQSSIIPWDLPEVSENLTDLWVHFRAKTASSTGAADSFAIQARFNPQMSVQRGLRASPGGQFMVDTLQVFGIDSLEGIEDLEQVARYRRDENDSLVFVEDITPPSWTDPVVVHWDAATEELVDGQVKATLRSDFGFSSDAVIELRVPDPPAVGEPAIEIVEGAFPTTRDIHVVSTASDAGYILLSEKPDFAGATWVTWADTVSYELADTLGARFLFAAFSNPVLIETVVTSTPVTLVSPPSAPHRR
jgi:hypothetical protein